MKKKAQLQDSVKVFESNFYSNVLADPVSYISTHIGLLVLGVLDA